MKTLDLRNLPPEARIAAINEAVALMEGWHKSEGHKLKWMTPSNGVQSFHRKAPPPYAGPSCDAVMPLLEKWVKTARAGTHNEIGIYHNNATWQVVLRGWEVSWNCVDESLPIAACIALLRAHGVEVLT